MIGVVQPTAVAFDARRRDTAIAGRIVEFTGPTCDPRPVEFAETAQNDPWLPIVVGPLPMPVLAVDRAATGDCGALPSITKTGGQCVDEKTGI